MTHGGDEHVFPNVILQNKIDLIKKDINEKWKMRYLYITDEIYSSLESNDEIIIEKKKPQYRKSLSMKNNRVLPTKSMISGQEIEQLFVNSEQLFTKISTFDNNPSENVKEIAHKGVKCNIIVNNCVERKKNNKCWSCFKFFKRN